MSDNINNSASKNPEALDNEKSASEHDSEYKQLAPEILNNLYSNDTFEHELELILLELTDTSIGLNNIEAKVILLIKGYLESHHKNLLETKKYEVNQKKISEGLQKLSHKLITEKLLPNKKELAEFNNQNKLYNNSQGHNSPSYNNFRRIVRSFIIYQIYKALNPRRIAGESRKQNFAHNVILRGLKTAKRYPGGTPPEIAKYQKDFLKKLEAQHTSFQRELKKNS